MLSTEISQLPLDAVVAALQIAREAGATTALDVDIPRGDAIKTLGGAEDFERALKLADYLKPSKAAASEIVNEDDALRAVRAAIELRDAVAELRDELVQSSGIEFAVSIGVNSGDVFVGGGAGRETFATGDAVNVAARLEQGAEAWEILLGDRTYRLVETEVRAEPLEPMEVKGRSAAVRAWRLLELAEPEQIAALPTTSFVGRRREQEALREASRAGGDSAARAEAFTDALFVAFGREILKVVPGRVSTEVDAGLSFDREGSLAKARRLIALYEKAGVDRQRILIKVASTWEGIRAIR